MIYKILEVLKGIFTNYIVNEIDGKEPVLLSEKDREEITAATEDMPARDVFVFARAMENLAKHLRDVHYENMLEELLDHGNELSVSGYTVKRVEIPQYDYLDDAVLVKYEDMLLEAKERVKELNKSVKNRKDTLVEKDSVLKLTPKEQVRVYG